jgi:hypothetical protein
MSPFTCLQLAATRDPRLTLPHGLTPTSALGDIIKVPLPTAVTLLALKPRVCFSPKWLLRTLMKISFYGSVNGSANSISLLNDDAPLSPPPVTRETTDSYSL